MIYTEPPHLSPPKDGDGYVPPIRVFERASHHAIIALWVVFGLMALAFLTVSFLGLRVPKAQRVYHYIITIAFASDALAYFAMATHSGTGFVYIGHHVFRQFYWARYVEWLVSTPCVVLSLALLSGLSLLDTILLLISDVIMALMANFAVATHRPNIKWAYVVYAIVPMLYIIYNWIVPGRMMAAQKSNAVLKSYTGLITFTIVIYGLQLATFILTEVTRTLSVDQEIYTFAVIDVIGRVGQASWLLSVVGSVAEAKFKLSSFWTGPIGGSEYDSLDVDS